MDSSTKSKSEIFHKCKNQLERERYARCMTQTNEISAGSSESFHECKNCLARESSYACHRANENTEQVELRRKKQNEAKQQITNAACVENYDTNAVSSHNYGSINIKCPECKALHWVEEKVAETKQSPIFSICYIKRKVQLFVISTPSILLHKLLTEESAQAHDFRKKIHIYNLVLAFTSMGAKIDECVAGIQGVYNFRIQEELYHRIGSLMPKNQDTLSFCQIYLHDTNEQLQQRQQLMPNLNLITLAQLQAMLHDVNPYVHIFQNVAYIIKDNPTQDLKIVITKT
ncbi:9648_t:CDS:2 [Cetraspora pellucida]|uniref:9648_t:CDS:1 n=1 Tax=Cetraspora pellucida TaxID=1433469 RepID=A0A9N9C7Y3_9GLOM|nr:9648_t:CDS:2 [Cetraspora pellucida]